MAVTTKYTELQKLHEALNLCQTKRANTTRMLEQIDTQLEWYKDFTRLTRQLNDAKALLYEQQKHLAEATSERQLIERFDALTPVQELFFRNRLQAEVVGRLHEGQRNYQTEVDSQRNLVTAAAHQAEDGKRHLENSLTDWENKQQILLHNFERQGQRNVLIRNLEDKKSQLQQLRYYLDDIDKNLIDNQNTLRVVEDNIRAEEEIQSALETHQVMLSQGGMILEKLETLTQIHLYSHTLRNLLDKQQQRQEQSNETLGELFLKNNDIEQQIATQKSELQMHRQYTRGVDGYALQRRAADLNTRLQMLKSARHLWNRIAMNYDYMEEKELEVIRTQRHYDQVTDQLGQMESEVARLTSLVEEQKYAFTISKSEHITNLRSDLNEGSPCSVCGATHHPYHTETELAMGELIKNLRREYEHSSTLLYAKRKELEELRLQHATEEGRLAGDRENLQQVRRQLDSNKEGWTEFANLDASLVDCSHQVNRESRKLMLQQLIERTTSQAAESQKELELFNFHQSNIDTIQAQIDKLEDVRSNNLTRINEVNTACQVLARETERTNQLLTENASRFKRYYEELEHLITYPLWHSEWQDNANALMVRLQGMIERWQKCQHQLQVLALQQASRQAVVEGLRQRRDYVEGLIKSTEERVGELEELIQTEQRQQDKELLGMSPEDFVHHLSQNLHQQLHDERHLYTIWRDHQEELACRQRIQEQNAEQLNQQTALQSELRYKMDIWLRHFNAVNPPAQDSELVRLFITESGWVERRQRILELQNKVAIYEHDVDNLRQALVAHQALSMRPSDRDDESRDALSFRRDELLRQADDLAVQYATLTMQIQSLETAYEQVSVR